ncbi:MAG: hypothetical protein R3C44_21835 [Chloroflexota bacterium]
MSTGFRYGISICCLYLAGPWPEGDHAHLSVYQYDDYTDPVSCKPVIRLATTALVVPDAIRALE